jgi:hypothetical protein
VSGGAGFQVQKVWLWSSSYYYLCFSAFLCIRNLVHNYWVNK